MRRGGIFALVTYIIYTLLCGGLAFAFYDEIKNPDSQLSGTAALVMLLVWGLVVSCAIGGFIAVILKLLHMATGWLIFGIPCILIDIGTVGSALSSIVELGSYSGETIILLIPLAVSVGALISNIKSLKN